MEIKMIDSTISQFWNKCEVIRLSWAATSGTNEIEHLLIELLMFVRSHPEAGKHLKECFERLVFDRNLGPLEIIIFCMRELRWPEIKDAVLSKMKGTNDPRILAGLDSVLAVYEDEWEDSDLYEYYRGKL